MWSNMFQRVMAKRKQHHCRQYNKCNCEGCKIHIVSISSCQCVATEINYFICVDIIICLMKMMFNSNCMYYIVVTFYICLHHRRKRKKKQKRKRFPLQVSDICNTKRVLMRLTQLIIDVSHVPKCGMHGHKIWVINIILYTV